jgi:uncharacterized protein (DUF4415 family)
MTRDAARQRASAQPRPRRPSDDAIARAASEDPDARLLTEAELAGGRTIEAPGKVAVSLRIDRAVLDAFKATGRGWQTRMNDALAASVTAAAGDDADPLSDIEAAAQRVIARVRALREA